MSTTARSVHFPTTEELASVDYTRTLFFVSILIFRKLTNEFGLLVFDLRSLLGIVFPVTTFTSYKQALQSINHVQRSYCAAKGEIGVEGSKATRQENTAKDTDTARSTPHVCDRYL